MKKGLLLFAAAVLLAASANATVKHTFLKNAKPVALKERVNAQTAQMKMNAAEPWAVADSKQFSRRAEAGATTYILDYKNWDRDFTTSSTFTIENVAEGQMELDMYGKDEKDQYPTFTYNVKISGFTDDNCVAYGHYDAETSQILVPVQTMFTHAKYGRIVLSGLALDSEDEPIASGYEFVFDVDQDGNVTLNQDEFSETDPETQEVMEGLYVGGFYNIMPDYPAASGNPSVWNSGFEIEMFTPNAVVASKETHVASGGWTDWVDMIEPVCIEDWGNEIVIHNFLSSIPVSMSKDENNYSITLPVKVDNFEYSVENGAAFEAGFMQLWRDGEAGDLVNTGAMTGKLVKYQDNNAIRFYDTEYREAWTDEQGEHEAGNYIINQYFYLGTLPNSEGARYWMGERKQLIIVANDGALPAPTGIKDINANSQKNIGKIYNLMGQEVSKDAKGLVIRDGKKYVVK